MGYMEDDMSDNEKLLRQAERYAGMRRALLFINALSYFVWIGAQALQFLPGFTPHQSALIQFVAGPIWLVSLLCILVMGVRLYMRRDLHGLIDDERTIKIGNQAFQAGYWVLLIGIALVYALLFCGIQIEGGIFLPILLSLGVAVPGLTYAALYRS